MSGLDWWEADNMMTTHPMAEKKAARQMEAGGPSKPISVSLTLRLHERCERLAE